MKILSEKMFNPVHMLSGDCIHFTYSDKNGVLCEHTEAITQPTMMNKMVVFTDDERFGMTNTYGMVVGRAK